MTAPTPGRRCSPARSARGAGSDVAATADRGGTDRADQAVARDNGLLMIAGGVGAGIFGSLLGLGGGVLIVPLLTLGFGLPIREAAGVSLVSVIVTSSAAASVYLQRHTANLRLGMTLELFTAMGALVGGLIAFTPVGPCPGRPVRGAARLHRVHDGPAPRPARPRRPARPADRRPTSRPRPPTGRPATAAAASRSRAGPGRRADAIRREPDAWPLAGSERRGIAGLCVRRRPLERSVGPRAIASDNLAAGSIVGAFFAGIVSAVLGVGGGIVKVPVMHLAMGVPLRIATATSNLMIGVTATASAIVYLIHGGIDPYVAGPIAVGVFVGASIGSRVAPRVDVRLLRLLFVVVHGLHGAPDDPPRGASVTDQAAGPRRAPIRTASARSRSGPRPDGRARFSAAARCSRSCILAIGVVLMAVNGRLATRQPSRPSTSARSRRTSSRCEPAGFLWLGLIAMIATPITAGRRLADRLRPRRRPHDGPDLARHPRRDRRERGHLAAVTLSRWTSSCSSSRSS